MIFSVEEKSRRSQYEVVKERIVAAPHHGTTKPLRADEPPVEGFHGDDRDRTGDLRRAKPSLSQLSYVPISSGRS